MTNTNGTPQPGPGDLDPRATLDTMGAHWSPDLDAYASGQLDASQVRCVLCGHSPCDCAPFGSAAYFAALDRLHGRKRPAPQTCQEPGCPLTAQLGEHPAGLAIGGSDGNRGACTAEVTR